MPVRFTAAGVTLEGGRSPLPEGSGYDLIIDEGGLSLSGGSPIAAWQIPYQALSGTTLERQRLQVVLGAWVSGAHLRLLFDPVRLKGGSLEELEAMLAGFDGRAPRGVRSKRPKGWLVAGLGAVLVALALALTLVFSSSGSTPTPPTISGAERAATQARNLVVVDLPSGWSADSPSTAPLAGLMGINAGTTAPTAADKSASKAIEAKYEACMGTTDASDRVFGHAGVKPALQLPSEPIGLVAHGSFFEVGTATQRYASESQVSDDLVQLRSKKFPACFAAALGRLASGAKPTDAVTTTEQQLPRTLGVFTTGANVLIKIPDGSGGATPAELGVTLLVQGEYEQTLFTFATPGTFPATLRNQLVATLAARLGGASGSSSA